MKRKRFGISICGLLFAICSIARAVGPTDKLHKAFYYEEKGKKDALSDMDLGRIELLFLSSKKKVEPIITRKQEGALRKDTYLFPSSILEGAEARSFVKKLNAATSKHYRFQLQQTKGKTPGLELVVQYDPKKVSIEPRSFKTISLKKGVEFRFHDQSLIDAIRERSEAKTRISLLKKKESSLLIVDMEGMIREQQVFLA